MEHAHKNFNLTHVSWLEKVFVCLAEHKAGGQCESAGAEEGSDSKPDGPSLAAPPGMPSCIFTSL